MVVFGGPDTQTDRCQIFEQLVPEWIKPDRIPYLLRDINFKEGNNDIGKDVSLNYCHTMTTNAYMPQHFKIGKISPGVTNDCKGLHFTLENRLNVTLVKPVKPTSSNPSPIDPNVLQPLDLEDTSPEGMCSPAAASPAQLSTVSKESSEKLLRESLKRASSEPQCRDETDDDILLENDLELAKKRKVANFEVKEKDAEFYWETTKHFKNEWLDQMRQNHGELMPVDEISRRDNIKKWFRYKPNTVTPLDSTYSCRICEDHHKEAGISTNHLCPLTNTEGKAVTSNIKTNKELIYGHHKRGVHISVVNYLKKKEEAKLLQSFQKAEEMNLEKDCDKYAVTRTMFRLIYIVNMGFPIKTS